MDNRWDQGVRIWTINYINSSFGTVAMRKITSSTCCNEIYKTPWKINVCVIVCNHFHDYCVIIIIKNIIKCSFMLRKKGDDQDQSREDWPKNRPDQMKCIGKSWSVWPYQKVNSFKWLPFGYKQNTKTMNTSPSIYRFSYNTTIHNFQTQKQNLSISISLQKYEKISNHFLFPNNP